MIISLSRTIFAKECEDFAKEYSKSVAKECSKDFAKEYSKDFKKICIAKDYDTKEIFASKDILTLKVYCHRENNVVVEINDIIVLIEIVFLVDWVSLITTMTTNVTTMIFLNQSTLWFDEAFRKARFVIFKFAIKWKTFENSNSIIRSRRQFRDMWTTFLLSLRTTMSCVSKFTKWA